MVVLPGFACSHSGYSIPYAGEAEDDYIGNREVLVESVLFVYSLFVGDSCENDPTGPLQCPVEEGITLRKASNEVIPVYNGGIEVLMREPLNKTTLVGWIYVKEKTTRDKILEIMKAVASQNGADKIVLLRDEPEKLKGDYLYWSARALRTEQRKDSENDLP
jgi:hypothetical protein